MAETTKLPRGQAARKAWNGVRVADLREPEWRGRVPDTSHAVSCELCGRRWLDQSWLALYHEADHNVKPAVRRTKTEAGAEALQLVKETIARRIGACHWRSGREVQQSKLASELGVSMHFVTIGVRQLAEEGLLR